MTSVLPASPPAAQPADLGPDHLDGRFSLLAGRSLSIAVQRGVSLHVRGGELRVRESSGLMELCAYANTELHIEWPLTRL